MSDLDIFVLEFEKSIVIIEISEVLKLAEILKFGTKKV